MSFGDWLDFGVLAYFMLINTIYTVLIALSVGEMFRRDATRRDEFFSDLLGNPDAPPISIIAPAYNESASVVESVRGFLHTEYPQLSVIVVNDGSKDDTLQRLKDAFDLVPVDQVVHRRLETKPVRQVYQSADDNRLWVIDKENGGKADALNCGLNLSRSPLVCCVDADTIVERKALLHLVEPFLYEEVEVAAVGGTVRLANGCAVKEGSIVAIDLPEKWIARFQIVEYLRAFLFGRLGYNAFGGGLIISGAFGVFSRRAVIEAGGYLEGSVGEDMELVVRLHRRFREQGIPYKVVYLPDPICFTEAPESYQVLGRQRDRWHRGLIDTLWRHRDMFLNPAYGATGLLVYPIFVLLEFLGPLVELFGYFWFLVSVTLGGIDSNFAMMFFLVAFFWGFLLSLGSLLLDDLEGGLPPASWEMRRGLIIAALAENLGYRQLTLIFRLRGMYSYLRGSQSWGNMMRKGYQKVAT